jgi:hypothetical protein
MTRPALATGLLALLLTACGDGGAILTTTTTTTTTVAPATTSSTTTPSTLPPTTTTAATTTTTTTSTTTTTIPAPVVRFLPDGLDAFTFGDAASDVMTAATALFGPPSSDTGWLAGGFGDYGVCPGSEFRQVSYLGDTLTLMFSDVEYFAPGGVRNFIYYSYYSPAMAPLTDGPPASIDVGVTVADLLAIWPAAEVTEDDPIFGPRFVYRPGSGFEGLYGSLTGVADDDVITYVSGGVGCGE